MVNPAWVHALDMTVDGRAVAAACGDGVVRTFGLFEGKPERRLELHRQRATCIAFPRNSPPHTLLSGGDDRRVILANAEEPLDDEDINPVLLDIDHHAKPNWIHYTAYGTAQPGPHFFVADAQGPVVVPGGGGVAL
ncbi:hypothetical protein T484DRAFT_1905335 [Baffinella frigidus]|nr:hypothetical protein T484DRAFT_1905335 [Cryptophyta sp. CCMP2293]